MSKNAIQSRNRREGFYVGTWRPAAPVLCWVRVGVIYEPIYGPQPRARHRRGGGVTMKVAAQRLRGEVRQ